MGRVQLEDVGRTDEETTTEEVSYLLVYKTL
jgi:hypothetical protein